MKMKFKSILLKILKDIKNRWNKQTIYSRHFGYIIVSLYTLCGIYAYHILYAMLFVGFSDCAVYTYSVTYEFILFMLIVNILVVMINIFIYLMLKIKNKSEYLVAKNTIMMTIFHTLIIYGILWFLPFVGCKYNI